MLMVVLVQEAFKESSMENQFQIEQEIFYSPIEMDSTFVVHSSPLSYEVELINENNSFLWLQKIVDTEEGICFYIDANVFKILKTKIDFKNHNIFLCQATEENKNINSVLQLCNFLQENNVNRGSMVYVVGGGITQDIGAYACKTLKRGVPWTFIPTTLLSQCDSCIGGKTAVNHEDAKNILGLFSAPRKVIIDLTFLDTLNDSDLLSGFGEILKLCITGGKTTFKEFSLHINQAMQKNKESLMKLILTSLCVKKHVVERDEFELNIRKAMNYGHSVGHTLEALTHFAIPHGLAVTYGLLVENMLAYNKGFLAYEVYSSILVEAQKILTKESSLLFKTLNTDNILYLLKNDKKAVGKFLNITTMRDFGYTIFSNLPLDELGVRELENAILTVADQL